MRKLQKLFVITLIMLMLLSQISYASTEILNIIKIGLQYSSLESDIESPLVNISTDTSFEFGQLLNDEYIKLFEFDNLNQFKFEKDNTYHVSLLSYNTYEEAVNFTKNYNINGMYIVKNDNYQVYVGNYNSPSEAQNSINSIYKSTGLSGSIVDVNKEFVLVNKNGNAIFGFDSASGEYIMSPVNSNLKNQYSYFGDTTYRGGFGAKRLNTNDITLINYVHVDEYLYGVVPREMSKDWHIEALKAQAIVARNFAFSNQNKFSHYGFNLDATVNSQVYAGYGWEGPLSNSAVDETSGLSLKYGNTLVSAYYHSNSGGYTENSENVWSSEVPYIKGVADPYSIGAPNDSWTLTYSASFIENRLIELGYDIGTLRDFSVQEYTPNNRAYRTIFLGTKENVILDKQTIRKAFGYNELKSTLITIHPDNEVIITDGSDFYQKRPNELHVISAGDNNSLISDSMVVYNGDVKTSIDLTPDQYTIQGKGWGHGLGMSQWGAKNMAELGFTFEQILTHYYTGTHIE